MHIYLGTRCYGDNAPWSAERTEPCGFKTIADVSDGAHCANITAVHGAVRHPINRAAFTGPRQVLWRNREETCFCFRFPSLCFVNKSLIITPQLCDRRPRRFPGYSRLDLQGAILREPSDCHSRDCSITCSQTPAHPQSRVRRPNCLVKFSHDCSAWLEKDSLSITPQLCVRRLRSFPDCSCLSHHGAASLEFSDNSCLACSHVCLHNPNSPQRCVRRPHNQARSFHMSRVWLVLSILGAIVDQCNAHGTCDSPWERNLSLDAMITSYLVPSTHSFPQVCARRSCCWAHADLSELKLQRTSVICPGSHLCDHAGWRALGRAMERAGVGRLLDCPCGQSRGSANGGPMARALDTAGVGRVARAGSGRFGGQLVSCPTTTCYGASGRPPGARHRAADEQPGSSVGGRVQLHGGGLERPHQVLALARGLSALVGPVTLLGRAVDRPCILAGSVLVLPADHSATAPAAGLPGTLGAVVPRIPAPARCSGPRRMVQRGRAATTCGARDRRPHHRGEHRGPGGYRCRNGRRRGAGSHRAQQRASLLGPSRAGGRTSGLGASAGRRCECPHSRRPRRRASWTLPTEGLPRLVQAQAQADATASGGIGGLLVGCTGGTGARPATGPRSATGQWPASRRRRVDPSATGGRPIRGKRGSESGKAGAPPPYSWQSVWLAVSHLQVPQFLGQAQLPRGGRAVSQSGSQPLPLRLGQSAAADASASRPHLQVKKPPSSQRATSALSHPC